MRKPEEAEAAVRTAHLKYPDDLACYVGMLQVSKSFREDEVMRRRTALQSKPDDWRAQFRLGAALWMVWAGDPGRENERKKPVWESVQLLKLAWESSHDVVVGLVLAEALWQGTGPYKGLTDLTVARELLRKRAGPRAWSHHLRASRSRWKSPPPAPDLVPAERRRALMAVLRAHWSRTGSRSGPAVIKNGRLIPKYNPVPPLTLAEHAYYKKWLDSLDPQWRAVQ